MLDSKLDFTHCILKSVSQDVSYNLTFKVIDHQTINTVIIF